MKGTLKDYYITSDTIAGHWNEIKYQTRNGSEWDADKVTKKFKMILKCIDEIAKTSNKMENLYRSENGEFDGHFIFFVAGEIMQFKKGLENASLHEYIKLLDQSPSRFREYETDTADTMKYIFEMWDEAGGLEYFTSCELEELEEKMKNLLPEHRNMEKLGIALSTIEKEGESAYDSLKKLVK